MYTQWRKREKEIHECDVNLRISLAIFNIINNSGGTNHHLITLMIKMDSVTFQTTKLMTGSYDLSQNEHYIKGSPPCVTITIKTLKYDIIDCSCVTKP